MRYANKIICLKEEADSSSINQAYDKFTANEDKQIQQKTLPMVRNMTGSITDQWGLVHCGLVAIRHSKKNNNIWIDSFRAVNLDPTCQMPFLDWIKKIEPFLYAEDSFKSDDPDVIDEYLYLPNFWHAMLPQEKKQALIIIKKHDSRWPHSCVEELHTGCCVTLADMHLLQTCISLAIANPAYLERGVPTNDDNNSPRTMAAVEEDAEKTRKNANHGLNNWQLHPEGMTGVL